jgi:hypothetical protein
MTESELCALGITFALAYSDTRFSKKFVLPWSEIWLEGKVRG